MWLQTNWPFLVTAVVALAALLAVFIDRFSGDRKKQREAWKQQQEEHEGKLANIRRDYERELNATLDLKVKKILELEQRVSATEAELSAIARLYQANVIALQRANAENEDLKRQLSDYEELKGKLRDAEEKIEEYHSEIRRLRERIESLEKSRDVTPTAPI